MSAIVNQAQFVQNSAQNQDWAAAAPTQRFLDVPPLRLPAFSLLTGAATLLATLIWALPSQAEPSPAERPAVPLSTIASDVAPDIAPDIAPEHSSADAIHSPDRSSQPVAQQGPTIPLDTVPTRPQNQPTRGVILTPSTPNRTIIPPPTTAFPYEESYTLGPSDQIELNIFDVPELSGVAGRYIVQLDGTINLNWAGVVRVQGLTLRQAEQVITQAYAPFVRNPIITLNLVSTRSLRISVAGEVRRPGVYVISPEGATDNRILIEGTGADGGVANQWPTVTKALQAAGGITQFADLRRIQVRRPLTDGSLEIVDVNLWELLRTGELNQDVRLRDRDTLVIPTATTLNDSEALVLGAANFSPEAIRVNVIGEVSNPGILEIPPNTPLNQALFTAGGFSRPRARTSRVELVRLNPNGTAVRRTVEVDLAAGINDATNPALRDYDTIIISRNGTTTVGDRVETFLRPVDAILGTVGSFLGIFDTFGVFDDGDDDDDDDDDDDNFNNSVNDPVNQPVNTPVNTNRRR
ncbi:MAG: hypothetical protein HC827_10445 [Cyanobacteria bacterium RM1_2_2]|nr:hypothetical protein [Cyanobacteria bacterium RM1_2_2]